MSVKDRSVDVADSRCPRGVLDDAVGFAEQVRTPCTIPGAIAREDSRSARSVAISVCASPSIKAVSVLGPDRDPSAKSSALSVQPHVGVFDALGVLRAVLDQVLGELVRAEVERLESLVEDEALAVLGLRYNLPRVGRDLVDDGARRARRNFDAEPRARIEVRHAGLVQRR